MLSGWILGPRRETRVGDGEIRELTAQFYVTLEAAFAKVKSISGRASEDAYRRIEDLLAPEHPRNWTNAYAIEQLLVHLMDDDAVATELQVRTREATAALRRSLAEYYEQQAAKDTQTPVTRRALLTRLVNDLQWRYTVNEVKRQYSKNITLNAGRFFAASLAIFAVAMLATVVSPELRKSDLRLLVPAVLAGCWGAGFSLLSSLKDRLDASELDDLKVLRAKSVLGSRLLIGAGAAAILYFFFVAGLVSGGAFPDLAKDKLEDWQKNLALLVAWCFLAGFSERLIPGLLARTEGRLDGASERFRPGGSPSGGGPPPQTADPQKEGAAAAAAAAAASGTAAKTGQQT